MPRRTRETAPPDGLDDEGGRRAGPAALAPSARGRFTFVLPPGHTGPFDLDYEVLPLDRWRELAAAERDQWSTATLDGGVVLAVRLVL